MPDTVRAVANDSVLTLAYSSANRIVWHRVSLDGRLLDTAALVLRSASPTLRVVRLTELDGTIVGMLSDQQTVVTWRPGQRPDQFTFHAAESESNRGRYVPLAIVALHPDTLALLVPRLMPAHATLGERDVVMVGQGEALTPVDSMVLGNRILFLQTGQFQSYLFGSPLGPLIDRATQLALSSDGTSIAAASFIPTDESTSLDVRVTGLPKPQLVARMALPLQSEVVEMTDVDRLVDQTVRQLPPPFQRDSLIPRYLRARVPEPAQRLRFRTAMVAGAVVAILEAGDPTLGRPSRLSVVRQTGTCVQELPAGAALLGIGRAYAWLATSTDAGAMRFDRRRLCST
ncbi:MAG: hypothetical protein K2R93_06445 [Gemmatimonadaceae bacterium]|nr:hypothetical protein [Gemmatimonadaceae bacterium]